MTFADPVDYEKINQEDRVSVTGLSDLAPGRPISIAIYKKDGSEITIEANHSMTEPQIKWFKAGSALNALNYAFLMRHRNLLLSPSPCKRR